MLIDFQASCEAEMDYEGEKVAPAAMMTGTYLPLSLNNGDVLRILQLIQARDAIAIAKGLLKIEPLAKQLKMSFKNLQEVPLDLSNPPRSSNLAVSFFLSSGACGT